MAQRVKVPILILTGFLGSGKTSLLARWLRAPEFAGAMVIVNELGEVGLDDRLVETSSEAPLLLENGCACCAASEDLNATLERLFWQRLHRTIPPFSWVLIETTGIADPQPIIASLQGHALQSNALIAERYDVAGVITTFDARRGPAQLLRHPECESQLAHASAIVLTKTDIATAQEIDHARAAIRSVRPQAAVMASANGALPASSIVAALQDATAPDHVCTDACHDHHHHHHHDHHDHAHHSSDVTSAFAPLFSPIGYDDLASALRATLAAHETAILRVKGTARSAPGDKAGSDVEIIQTMPGEAIERVALVGAAADRPVGMTFIAQGTPASVIASDFLARLGLAAIVTENVVGVHAGVHAHG